MNISCRDGIQAIDGGRVVLQYREIMSVDTISYMTTVCEQWIEYSLHGVFLGYLDIIIVIYNIFTRVSAVVDQLCAVPSEATPEPPCTWSVSGPMSLRTQRKQL